MKIYAKFDSDGFPLAFYSPDVHGDGIPQEVIEITLEQWQHLLSNQGFLRWDGETIVEYTPSLEPVDLIAYAADKRWQMETGGFEFSGLHIATDDRSKIMMAGAREAAKANPDFTTPWVTSTGEIAVLDAVLTIAISDAVGAHVNDVFRTYAQVLPQIIDGTITDQSQIDAAFA